jgi:AraC family transcriptional activator of mtrCDE
MDALSKLLSLYPIRTALDTRCRGAASWKMHHGAQPHGTAPYHLIVEGTTLLMLAGHPPRQLVAGDMLVLPRGQAHSLDVGAGASDGAATDILCGQFHFGAAATGPLLHSLPDIVLIRTAGANEFAGLQALMNVLRDESSLAHPGAGAVVSHVASALFALMLRAWLRQAKAVPGLFAVMADQRLVPALNAMLTDPGQAWDLPQLAQLCHMSRATFLRSFRKNAGTTPGELLLQVRMALAMRLLKESHRSIGEVAASVGYQSEASFSRAFKRFAGAGPGQCRREPQGAPLP